MTLLELDINTVPSLLEQMDQAGVDVLDLVGQINQFRCCTELPLLGPLWSSIEVDEGGFGTNGLPKYTMPELQLIPLVEMIGCCS